jgi:hypothetical protein
VAHIPELRGQYDILPLLGIRLEPHAEQFLAIAICIGCIPESFSRSIYLVKKLKTFCQRGSLSVESTSPHEAHADGRDFGAILA